MEEANRIRKPSEEPKRVGPAQTQEVQRSTTLEGSGGVTFRAQDPKSENLKRELADLEDQYQRMKNLEGRSFNNLGQRLLGYKEGFCMVSEVPVRVEHWHHK